MAGDLDALKDEMMRVTGLDVEIASNVVVPVVGDRREWLWDVALGAGSVERLRAEYVSGRIGVEEFEARVAVAVASEADG
jgi:hypothetical protein